MDDSLRKSVKSDRAWNDPPPLAFSSQPTITKTKNILNKRIPFPQTGALLPTEASKVKNTESSTLNSLPPAAKGTLIATHAPCDPVESEKITTDILDVHTTLNRLKKVLNECQNSFQKRIFDDVTRRLMILQNMWVEGKLNDVIHQRVNKLSEELARGKYEDANQIHLSLAIDYPGLVSSWLVGIKHLIHQAKSVNLKIEELITRVEGQSEGVEVENNLPS